MRWNNDNCSTQPHHTDERFSPLYFFSFSLLMLLTLSLGQSRQMRCDDLWVVTHVQIIIIESNRVSPQTIVFILNETPPDLVFISLFSHSHINFFSIKSEENVVGLIRGCHTRSSQHINISTSNHSSSQFHFLDEKYIFKKSDNAYPSSLSILYCETTRQRRGSVPYTSMKKESGYLLKSKI